MYLVVQKLEMRIRSRNNWENCSVVHHLSIMIFFGAMGRAFEIVAPELQCVVPIIYGLRRSAGASLSESKLTSALLHRRVDFLSFDY